MYQEVYIYTYISKSPPPTSRQRRAHHTYPSTRPPSTCLPTYPADIMRGGDESHTEAPADVNEVSSPGILEMNMSLTHAVTSQP